MGTVCCTYEYIGSVLNGTDTASRANSFMRRKAVLQAEAHDTSIGAMLMQRGTEVRFWYNESADRGRLMALSRGIV
ncbi:hypothetical protein BN2475_220041 [Paraburkholderia ribeironis]|uniref:Uncharacterized protein n=1 Tax=Paraburkholderia ribeironis TaxID=1247936 RepID=A0A1N7RXD0_9BURK|nr:hypothetical protein BN2475_220041 [Paraburkholderia ribeironis]